MFLLEFKAVEAKHDHQLLSTRSSISFSRKFEAGKAYCFKGNKSFFGSEIIRIVSGLKRGNKGVVFLNNQHARPKDLKKASMLMGNQFPLWIARFLPTIKEQLIKAASHSNFINKKEAIEEAIEFFGLQETRLTRRLSQVSNEQWRATMAIAYLAQKKVYAFPWRPAEYWEGYKDLWLKRCFNKIKSTGAIIIFPTNVSESLIELFDEIIPIESSYRTT